MVGSLVGGLPAWMSRDTSSPAVSVGAGVGGGPNGGGFHGHGSADVGIFDDTVASEGTYVDDGSQTSAEKARDDNLGILNQLIGSLNGYNQKILQDLMQSATKAQYDYLERMSNSAYQRAVSDMKKAGLNPAVMFANGSGSSASTPQVGISQVATENQLLSAFSSVGQFLSGAGNLIGSILQYIFPKLSSTTNTSDIVSNISSSSTSKNYNYNYRLK